MDEPNSMLQGYTGYTAIMLPPRLSSAMRSSSAPHDLLAALPHLRRYAAVLTDDEHEADSLIRETVARAREASLPEAAHPNVQTRLFALMHELHGGGAPMQRAPAPADVAAVAPSATEKSSGLLTRFRKLPTEEREILLLVAVERMRYDEIAAVLRVPVSTIMARLKCARDYMRGTDTSSEQTEQKRN